MPLLTHIPREIRDIILDLVLSSARPAPETPTTATAVSGSEGAPQRSAKVWYSDRLLLETREPAPNSRALLLVNHQIRAETKAVINRSYKTPSYALDVMFVDECEYWPTWVSIPTLSTRIDELNVTFRIFGEVDASSSLLCVYDGRSQEITQLVDPFYQMMLIFLHCGPVESSWRIFKADRKVTVKTLKLDFKTTNNISALPDLSLGHTSMVEWVKARFLERGNRPETFTFCMRPDWLAQEICDFIAILLSMDYGSLEYGQTIYERIGRINVFVDGKLYKDFNLAKSLAELDFGKREDTFGGITPNAWKIHAIKQRRTGGLPVSDQA